MEGNLLTMLGNRSELFQDPDPLFRAGVGGEEAAQKLHQPLRQLFRVDDVHLGNVFTFYVAESWISRDLAQGRGEGLRIATEFSTTCVGHELTLAGNSKAGEHDEEIGDTGTDGSDEQDDGR